MPIGERREIEQLFEVVRRLAALFKSWKELVGAATELHALVASKEQRPAVKPEDLPEN